MDKNFKLIIVFPQTHFSNYNLTEAELTMAQDSISKKYYWLLADITTEAEPIRKYNLKCYKIPRANNLERAWNAINP